MPSGHDTKIVAVALDVYKLIDELRNDRPDMIFNLCESFDGGSDTGNECSFVV
ncbi:MAG: hypothetical protein R2942_00355 [Ignavibacteria bacterium]